MTKVEAIKQVLYEHNGIASWKIIYDNIDKYYKGIKEANDWQAGIRGVVYREIRNNRVFKQIGLGLIGLIEYQEEKLSDVKADSCRLHSFIEGVCIDIGNFLKLDTYTADPSAIYNSMYLSNIATQKEIPNFTYGEIIDCAKRIDVLWFNTLGYKFPLRSIEIVDSIGTLELALKRSFQLLPFNLDFYLLTRKNYVDKVKKEINKEPYKRVKNRYFVMDYEEIMEIYSNPIQYQNHNFFNIRQFL